MALAYAASKSSRFNIGVGVSDTEVVLHEMHMPPEQPVLTFPFSGRADYFCRLMGANAARMIIRKPLRFEEELSQFESDLPGQETVEPVHTPPSATAEIYPANLSFDPVQIAKIVAVVVRKLQERGVQ